MAYKYKNKYFMKFISEVTLFVGTPTGLVFLDIILLVIFLKAFRNFEKITQKRKENFNRNYLG